MQSTLVMFDSTKNKTSQFNLFRPRESIKFSHHWQWSTLQLCLQRVTVLQWAVGCTRVVSPVGHTVSVPHRPCWHALSNDTSTQHTATNRPSIFSSAASTHCMLFKQARLCVLPNSAPIQCTNRNQNQNLHLSKIPFLFSILLITDCKVNVA